MSSNHTKTTQLTVLLINKYIISLFATSYILLANRKKAYPSSHLRQNVPRRGATKQVIVHTHLFSSPNIGQLLG